MNCVVSSIHPLSSTAPACRNISHGERAARAPAASAAARVPSNLRKPPPAPSAPRSIPPLPALSTNSTSRMTPAAAPGTSAASVATAGCSTPSVGMITLNMNEASVAQTGKNAELLSPCHNQSSRLRAVFCGTWRECLPTFASRCELLSMMFLICSFDVLCSLHEPSILSCPQAPAGHGALRTGGGGTLSRTRRRDREQAAARARRAVQRERPVRGRGARRLRRWLAESGRTAAVQDDGVARYFAQGHHPQRVARHRVRSFDQSLSRL